MTLVPGTLLLTRKDVAELMPLNDCVQVVEQAFRLQGEGRAPAPGVLGVHAQDGGFHIKTGTLPLGRNYFAAKTAPTTTRKIRMPPVNRAAVIAASPFMSQETRTKWMKRRNPQAAA